MTVLILGASGFLGRNLFAHFKSTGVKVFGTSRSGNTNNGFFRIDLGIENEHKKITSLVESHEVTQIVNLAAIDVSPVNRTEANEGIDATFLANLNTVLDVYRGIGLLQIGTYTVTEKEDSYFASKKKLRDSLHKSDMNEQITVLDLPKVVGVGEPLGRFTSDLIESLNTKREQTVLHPCHKRNFVAMGDVVGLISRIVEARNEVGSQFPMLSANVFSNCEIARMLIEFSSQNGENIKFDHKELTNECNICPADEEVLLIRPEFCDGRQASFYWMNSGNSVREALREQYLNTKTTSIS